MGLALSTIIHFLQSNQALVVSSATASRYESVTRCYSVTARWVLEIATGDKADGYKVTLAIEW